jgi:hypothetical protein
MSAILPHREIIPQRPDSLAYQGIYREFYNFGPSATILNAYSAGQLNGSEKNSLRNGTGNFLRRTGNYFQRTGNFSCPTGNVARWGATKAVP